MEIGRPLVFGFTIRTEILEELDLSIGRAAEVLGVRRATLSELVNEKAALSPEMALRIEKAFGLSGNSRRRRSCSSQRRAGTRNWKRKRM